MSDVKSIIDSYGLNNEQIQTVNILLGRYKDFESRTYAQKYEIISEIIYSRIDKNYIENNLTDSLEFKLSNDSCFNLSESIKIGSSTNLYETKYIEDEKQLNYLYQKKSLIKKIKSKKLEIGLQEFVINMIEDKNSFNFLSELCNLDSKKYNIDTIVNNLEIIYDKLYLKDKNFLANENVEIVRLSPLKIKVKNRKYNANPIDFYNKYKKIYQDLSHSELSYFDSGLYSRLDLYNQLKLVKNKKITINQKKTDKKKLELEDVILNSYDKFEGCPIRTSQELGYSIYKICTIWKKNKKKIKQIEVKYTGDIIYDYENNDLINQLSKTELNLACSSMYYNLYRLNLLDVLIDSKKKRTDLKEIELMQKDPVKYCKINYKNLTRTQLSKENSYLYRILNNNDLLDEAFPKRNYTLDEAINFYQTNYSNLSRKELYEKDYYFSNYIKEHGFIDIIIPKKNIKKFHTKKSAIKYYKTNYKNLTRTQLSQKDYKLYRFLKDNKLLDEIIPKKKSKSSI